MGIYCAADVTADIITAPPIYSRRTPTTDYLRSIGLSDPIGAFDPEAHHAFCVVLRDAVALRCSGGS